jgi:hypothetical protein
MSATDRWAAVNYSADEGTADNENEPSKVAIGGSFSVSTKTLLLGQSKKVCRN